MSPTAAGDSALSEFAQRWASALAWTSYVPMDRAERHATLMGFAARLVDGVVAEPFSEQLGYDIGTDLVQADFAAPEALGATILLIDECLLEVAGFEQSDRPARGRVARLLGALAAGYSWALRDRTLDEQESIRVAALVTREQAEQALRDSEARFRYAAQHDPLTGMPNRALFADRLDEIFRKAGPEDRVGLCFIDLDSFKAINDSLGHHMGDQVLIAVSERITRLTAELAGVAARFGGDEFVLLLEGTASAADAVRAADKVMEAITEPVRVNGAELPISASIGIVERQVAWTDPSDLTRAADITLHWAKSDGKARWCLFDSARNEREVARYTLATAMPAALDRGEFTLVYQPIVGLAHGTLDGVEALARWEHPDLGLLPPNQFISLAEDSGLIVPLGQYLLELACQQAAQWLSQDPRAPFVSVNLAARQIRDPGLIPAVTAVLDRTGLPPEKLHLEITESAIMGDDPETVIRLRDLADLGVQLAIDDFGTGYSNLAYVRSLPVHSLKLDGSFVDDLRRPGSAGGAAGRKPAPETAFLRILVNLGHTFGLTVTAEGVETSEQAEVLRAVGCESGQGYYLGYPDQPDRITQLLNRSRP